MEQNENASNLANNATITTIASADQLKKFHFWEKDRLESFKHWPFDNKSPCNVSKVSQFDHFL